MTFMPRRHYKVFFIKSIVNFNRNNAAVYAGVIDIYGPYLFLLYLGNKWHWRAINEKM